MCALLWILTETVFWRSFRWHNPSLVQRECDGGEQTTNLDKTECRSTVWVSLNSMSLWGLVGCLFNSDQALRSLCLKAHVRARGPTLWRHHWQEVTEFLCTKSPFLEGVQQPKNWPKTPRNALSDAILISIFQNFVADAAKKNTPRVLINSLILIQDQGFFTVHSRTLVGKGWGRWAARVKWGVEGGYRQSC